MPKVENLIGNRYGRLVVIEQGERHMQPSGQSKITWNCKCDCGNYVYNIVGCNLKRGMTCSCGCLHKEIASDVNRKYNQFDISGEYGIGWTNTGTQFFFDIEDYDKIKDFCWSDNGDGYIKNISNGFYLHRLIMSVDDEYEIDHIHGKKTRNDNRKSNLRIVTSQQNSMNVGIRKNNTSGVTGVCWVDKIGMYSCTIMIDGVTKSLGYFKNIEDAKSARLKAEDKYFKEYSYSNSQKIK